MLEYYYGWVFRGETREEVLESVVKLFGGRVFEEYINKYRIWVGRTEERMVEKWYEGKGLQSLKAVRPVPELVRDLMEKMLTIDHNDRIMPK